MSQARKFYETLKKIDLEKLIEKDGRSVQTCILHFNRQLLWTHAECSLDGYLQYWQKR